MRNQVCAVIAPPLFETPTHGIAPPSSTSDGGITLLELARADHPVSYSQRANPARSTPQRQPRRPPRQQPSGSRESQPHPSRTRRAAALANPSVEACLARPRASRARRHLEPWQSVPEGCLDPSALMFEHGPGHCVIVGGLGVQVQFVQPCHGFGDGVHCGPSKQSGVGETRQDLAALDQRLQIEGPLGLYLGSSRWPLASTGAGSRRTARASDMSRRRRGRGVSTGTWAPAPMAQGSRLPSGPGAQARVRLRAGVARRRSNVTVQYRNLPSTNDRCRTGSRAVEAQCWNPSARRTASEPSGDDARNTCTRREAGG